MVTEVQQKFATGDQHAAQFHNNDTQHAMADFVRGINAPPKMEASVKPEGALAGFIRGADSAGATLMGSASAFAEKLPPYIDTSQEKLYS